MYFKKIFSVTFLSCFLLTTNLVASDYFQKIVNTAYKNNYFIKSYEKSVRIAKTNITLSNSYFLPKIDFAYNFTQTDEPGKAAFMKAKQGKFSMDYYYKHMTDPPYIKNHQYIISLIQPIFSKGNVYLSKKQAEINYLAQVDSLNEIKREIKFKIFNVLINGYKTIDHIQIAFHMKKKAEIYYKMISELYKNGTSLKSDLLFAKYNLEKATVELNNVKNNLNKIKNFLKQITGKGFDIKKIDFSISGKINKNNLIDFALRNRDDLKAMRKYLQIADIEIRKTKNENLPALFGFANYERNSDDILRTDKDGVTAGIALKFNIFNGFRNSLETDKARFNYLKLQNSIKDEEENVKRRIENAFIDYQNSKFSFETYKELVKSNKTALKLSENRFKQGLERITTLTDMQTNYKNSLKEFSQSKWDLILKYYTILFEAGKF